jgi:hypothetical protein
MLCCSLAKPDPPAISWSPHPKSIPRSCGSAPKSSATANLHSAAHAQKLLCLSSQRIIVATSFTRSMDHKTPRVQQNLKNWLSTDGWQQSSYVAITLTVSPLLSCRGTPMSCCRIVARLYFLDGEQHPSTHHQGRPWARASCAMVQGLHLPRASKLGLVFNIYFQIFVFINCCSHASFSLRQSVISFNRRIALLIYSGVIGMYYLSSFISIVVLPCEAA